MDERGVDLTSGLLFLSGPSISIGPPGSGGLTYTPSYNTQTTVNNITVWRDNFTSGINASGNDFTVTLLGASIAFTKNPDGTFSPKNRQGGSLSLSGNIYTYTTRDGSIALYDKTLIGTTPFAANEGLLTTLTRPNLEVLTFTQTMISGFRLLTSVTNNFGYQIKFEYGGAYTWTPLKVIALNNAIDYCDPSANGCAVTGWPTLTFGWTASKPVPTSITNNLSETISFTYSTPPPDAGPMLTITYPGSAAVDVTITYNSGRVATYCYAPAASCNATNTYTYTYGSSGGNPTTTVSGPDSYGRVVTLRASDGRMISDRDGLNRTTTFAYDSYGRMTRVTAPEGNYTNFTLDDRGNITETRSVSKTSGTPADIVVTSAYVEGPSVLNCSNPQLCNQPATVTAPYYAGASSPPTTTYTYDAGIDQLVSVASPTVGGQTPTTSLAYNSFQARYRQSSAPSLSLGTAIRLPTTTTSCPTTTTCMTATAEGSLVEYQPNVDSLGAAIASNLLPISTTKGNVLSGGTLTAKTEMDYDRNGANRVVLGNVIEVDGPIANDEIYFQYDALRRQTGVIYADPDAGGTQIRPATQTRYNSRGQVRAVRNGLVAAANANLDAMTLLGWREILFDSRGRPVRANGYDNGEAITDIVAVTQSTFDGRDRLVCTAQRMNPTTWDSAGDPPLPDACTITAAAGGYPRDRIARTVYDAASQVIRQEVGVGTTLQNSTASSGYTSNGRLDWILDGNSNLSDLIYDGHDRLVRTNFPSTAQFARAANTGDNEQYALDAGGRVTSFTPRGTVGAISYQYDALGRPAVVTVPGSGLANDVFYSYDLMGRMLSARYDSTSSTNAIIRGYDALGRATTESSYGRQLTSDYDLASRRTRLTYPDSTGGAPRFIEYRYDTLNRLTHVNENNTTDIAVTADIYDTASNAFISTTTRANGTISRTTQPFNAQTWELRHQFVGTPTTPFIEYDYALNAGGQTTTRASTSAAIANASYAPAATSLTNYTADGLNRYANAGATTPSYDDRGNIIRDATRSFCYDAFNRLTAVAAPAAVNCASATSTISYDPLGRIREVYDGSGTRQFLYDGASLVAEYNGATMLTRYVTAGMDNPIVSYDGSTFATRTFYHQDELGSVVVTSNNAGAPTALTYSATGEPDAWGSVRYRYTGQIALNQAGLYHYKARAYDPVLGRFLQTDPISYQGGMNLYAYAGNDPVNNVDPFGLEVVCYTITLTFSQSMGGGYVSGTTCLDNGRPTASGGMSVECYGPNGSGFGCISPITGGVYSNAPSGIGNQAGCPENPNMCGGFVSSQGFHFAAAAGPAGVAFGCGTYTEPRIGGEFGFYCDAGHAAGGGVAVQGLTRTTSSMDAFEGWGYEKTVNWGVFAVGANGNASGGGPTGGAAFGAGKVESATYRWTFPMGVNTPPTAQAAINAFCYNSFGQYTCSQ